MKFTTLAVILAPFLPAILAAPRPNPDFFDDLGDAIGDAVDDVTQVLDDIGDITDDVKQIAEDSWDYEYDGCTAVQCAAEIGPVTLTCVTAAITENPIPCFVDVLAIAADPPTNCDGCPAALESYLSTL